MGNRLSQRRNYNTVANSVVTLNSGGIDIGDEGSHHNIFHNIAAYSNTGVAINGYAGSDYTRIVDSHLHDNNVGVQIGHSWYWSVENTRIHSNTTSAILIDTARYGTIKNNVLYANGDGIYFAGWAPQNNTIVGNLIYQNERGLGLYCAARYNIVRENLITQNGSGVYISKNITCPNYNNTFYHNDFLGNSQNALVEEDRYANTWDDGYPSGGNYWDDYSGVDLYSGIGQDVPGNDGIGDTTYVIDELNSDRYPLMRPWNIVQATVDIEPVTLNLKSKGKWVTAYIELLYVYDVADIDMSTVMLDSTIPTEDHPAKIGDYDDDGITDLMVKFDRRELIDYLGGTTGEVTLTLSGELNDGMPFEGSDIITVIKPGK